ncbi:carbohydrate ABC transporter permease [Pedococcus sp. 5OH_020]|uniref:carbohydrate ABC transporter permease n=1 Tax=Pedococcus sp. 5OH_020 TaxID=2989814 RepID=UPI0022E99A5D|nr:sugar ABC transporter permease [Pedococcus sp. 5OH_020]
MASKRPVAKARLRNSLVGLGFAAPFIVGFAVFIAYPLVASVGYSFTDFNLFQTPTNIGLANYQAMLHDDRLITSIKNTLLFAGVGVPLNIGIALVGAHLLNLPVRGQPLYRAMAYLPTIVPVVVGAYLWRWLLNPQYGFVDHLLRMAHLPDPNWLLEPGWARAAVIILSVWTVGGTMIVYLAGLREVPKDLYEAASLDGAGIIGKFRHITWPSLTPITLFQSIVLTIAYLQLFAQPYLLAQSRLNESTAGPGDSMLSYSMYLFQSAFVNLKMGYASAMAWVLFLFTMLLTFALLGSARKWVHYVNG